jgi:hypothetical protein
MKNYTITSTFDTEIGITDRDIGILTVHETINQGETNLHKKTVNCDINLLVIDLNWEDSSNSLSLKIYTPGGTVLGPYYDNEDGRIDSRIHLYIQNSNGIEKGSWKYKVYGYKVSGTEHYTI